MILPVISHVKFVIHQFLYAIKHTAYRSTQTISIRETPIFCFEKPEFRLGARLSAPKHGGFTPLDTACPVKRIVSNGVKRVRGEPLALYFRRTFVHGNGV
jgi:hypothetical protein